MQSFTTHRNPTAFPNPHTWNPDRWLTLSTTSNAKSSGSGAADAELAKELFMPFSKGPRACLGKNMAIMELKKTTATLITQTRVKVAPSTTDANMAMIDHFLAIPKGGKCELIFEKI